MLDKLRRRIVTLNVVFVGIILIIVCLLSYKYTENALLSTYKERFNSSCKLLENQITVLKSVNYRNIYEFEQSDELNLFFFDNDIYFEIPYQNEKSSREGLLSSTKAKVDKIKLDNEGLQTKWGKTRLEGDFYSDYQGERYIGRYISIPNNYGALLEIIALKSMKPYENELKRTRSFYLILTLGGFIVISGLNYVLAKKAIEPAIKAQKTQNEFVAAAGHELKSPLAVILASSQMMTNDSAHFEDYSANITGEAQRMAKLVDEMLLLARLNFNHAELERKEVDTEGLILSVYERFLPVARETGHLLELILPSYDLACTFVDEERIVQVLSVLITNAFSYTKRGVKVEINAQKAHKAVSVSVIDHGEGILEKKSVFDKFSIVRRKGVHKRSILG